MWIQSSWEEKNNMTKFWWKLIVKSQEEIGEIYHILCNAREAKQRILFWQKKDANVKPKETKIESEKENENNIPERRKSTVFFVHNNWCNM